jgi:hypothetical protein
MVLTDNIRGFGTELIENEWPFRTTLHENESAQVAATGVEMIGSQRPTTPEEFRCVVPVKVEVLQEPTAGSLRYRHQLGPVREGNRRAPLQSLLP